MSGPVMVTADARDLLRAGADVERLKHAVADHAALHAEIARDAKTLTKQWLLGLTDHKTATTLGAKPFHYQDVAQAIESTSDGQSATVTGPRASRLRAWEGSYTVRPKKAGGFLALPASARTYGRRAMELKDQTEFAHLEGRGLVLLFKGTREVAFTLRRQASIPQDREILPDEEAYQDVITGAITRRMEEAANNLA